MAKHGTFFIFPITLGMSSSQLTNSIIFQRGGQKPPTRSSFCNYPLVNLQKTMENHYYFQWVNPLWMAIFNSKLLVITRGYQVLGHILWDSHGYQPDHNHPHLTTSTQLQLRRWVAACGIGFATDDLLCKCDSVVKTAGNLDQTPMKNVEYGSIWLV